MGWPGSPGMSTPITVNPDEVTRRRRRRIGPERSCCSFDPGPGRSCSRCLRGKRHPGWRMPIRGAHASWLPPRRLFGGPPPSRGVPVFPRHRPRGSGREALRAKGGVRPSARRRARWSCGGFCRRDRSRSWRRRSRVPPDLRTTRARLATDHSHHPRASQVNPSSSAGDDALRPKRRSIGAISRQEIPHRRGPWPSRWSRRACDSSTEQAVNGLLRPLVHNDGAFVGVASRTRRKLSGDRRARERA